MPDCQIEAAKTTVLAFVIADVPVAALNGFLERSENLEYDSCWFRIMDSLDLDTITAGHDSKNKVPEDFVSPFLGWTVDKVKDWFIANLKEKPRNFFVNRNFVIIDEHVQEAEEENEKDFTSDTVLLCDAQTRLFKKVRIRSSMVLSEAISLDMNSTMREGSLGMFWRSGTTCTPEASQILSKGGWYFPKGIPEVHEGWRKFAEEWGQGGPNDYDTDEYLEAEEEEEEVPKTKS